MRARFSGPSLVGTNINVDRSYAGVGIQYVIPALACHYGRQTAAEVIGANSVNTNRHRSKFSSPVWVYITLAWSLICVGLVTYNHINQALK